MTQLRGEGAKSSTASSDGLTRLHRAVLKNDANAVRKIVSERELGVDVRTATGTTPLMIAALYGRLNIFLYLLGKKASPDKQDKQGNSPLAYVKQRTPSVKGLIQEYKNTATVGPERSGRCDIYVVLKAIKHGKKASHHQEHPAAQHEAGAQSQPQGPAQLGQNAQQQSVDDFSRRAVFLPSSDGKQLEFIEGRCVAAHERQSHKRKCTGVIRAVDDDTDMFAISGWGTERDGTVASRNTLDNTEYTRLMMRVAPILNFRLTASGLDHQFPGTAPEKTGAFWACHAEKQLALFVLKKALARVCGTDQITESSLTLLRDQLSKLSPGLRETVIHLNHEIACRNCKRFLEVLNQKTGLIFRVEFHRWYIEGKRSKKKLWVHLDGSVKRVTGAPEDLGANQNAELIDDELGLFDDEDDVTTHFQFDSADPRGNTVLIRTNPATPRKPARSRSSSPAQRMPRSPYQKEGSAVSQEPPYNSYPYPKFDVTPPSRNIQALPTPQSHAQLTGLPHIPASPSPAPRSSAVGSGIQTDSISPSLSQEFEVEEILQSKEENGVQWYLVKWRGYPYDNNSWEPEGHLKNATDAIRKFWEELQVVGSQAQDKAT